MSVNNESTGNENITDTKLLLIVNCVLNVPFMWISIVGNTLVLATIITNSSLRSPSLILLCGLAMADLAVGLIVQPLYIAKEITASEHLRDITAMMGFAFCGVSFGTMALISVDRFLALRCHLKYSTLVTSSRVVYSLVFVWLIHFVVLNRFFFPPKYIYVGFAMIFIYITAATVSYTGIYRIVCRHQLQIHVQQRAVQGSQTQNTFNVARLKRAAVNTFVFYICTILCYFPWFIYRLFYGDIFVTNQRTAWMVTNTLVFVNSSINPFLYGWRLRDLRLAVVKTLRKVLRKTEEGSGTVHPSSLEGTI